jgi:hypothetical protein
MHKRGMATRPSLSRRIVIHTHEDRPPEIVESHVIHVSTQTTRGTMCLLLNSSTATGYQ